MKNGLKMILCLILVACILYGGIVSVNADYTGRAYIFTYNSSELSSDFHDMGYVMYSRNDALYSLEWLWNMNYDAGEYLNNSVDPICDAMDTASIVTIGSHGKPGIIDCPDPHTEYAPRMTYLVGTGQSTDPTNYRRAVNRLGDLSNIKLLMLNTCLSAKTDPNYIYGNLKEEFESCGVNCVVAWKTEIPARDTYGTDQTDYTAIWLEYFFQACYFNHCTVREAENIAYQRMSNEGYETDNFKALEEPEITNSTYVLYPA